MNDYCTNIIGIFFNMKLKIADKALEYLPSSVQPMAREIRTQVLATLRDSFDRCLKDEKPKKEEPVLKKIDLE